MVDEPVAAEKGLQGFCKINKDRNIALRRILRSLSFLFPRISIIIVIGGRSIVLLSFLFHTPHAKRNDGAKRNEGKQLGVSFSYVINNRRGNNKQDCRKQETPIIIFFLFHRL